MPTTPLPIAAAAAETGRGQAPLRSGASQDGFASLLDIGLASADREAPPARAKESPRSKEPVAAAIQAPVEKLPEKPRAGSEEASPERPPAAGQAENDNRAVSVRKSAIKTIVSAAGKDAAPAETLAQTLHAQLARLQEILAAIADMLEGMAPGGVAVCRQTITMTQITTVTFQASFAGNAALFADMSQALRQLQAMVEALPQEGVSAETQKLFGAITQQIARIQLKTPFALPADGDALPLPEAAPSAAAPRNALTENLSRLQALLTRLKEQSQAMAMLQETPSIMAPAMTEKPAGIALPATISPAPEQAAAAVPAPQGEGMKPAPSQPQVFMPSVMDAQASDARTGGGTSRNDDGAPQTFLPPASVAQAVPVSETRGASFARMLVSPAHGPVLEQVVLHVKTALQDGTSRIRIQLDPAELGKLDIRLEIAPGGKTGVVITVDNRHTLDLLQRDARGLEQALADAGLKTGGESLSFNLRGGQPEGRENAHGGYGQAQTEEDEPLENAAVRSYVVNLAEGLDITI